MPQAYLPGDTRQRIQDLIKDNDITQAELASRRVVESAFSLPFIQPRANSLSTTQAHP